MPQIDLDPEQQALVRCLGPVELTWREWRWLGVAPHHVVLAAGDPVAWHRLVIEAKVIDAFHARAGTVVPRVQVSDDLARVQIRERADGITGDAIEHMVFGTDESPSAADRYHADCPLTPRGTRFATELGDALARIHHALDPALARRLGLGPEDRAEMAERAAAVIRGHVHDGGLLRHAVARAQTWLAALPPDPVVVQGDPHMHNMFVDGDTGALRAIIDYGDIRIAHRADDLRYLHSNGLPFVHVALAAYAATGGIAVDEATVGRYHALAALDHFAWVDPHAPRFPSIILWATAAVLALAPDWA